MHQTCTIQEEAFSEAVFPVVFPDELDPCPDDFDYTALYEETYAGLSLVSRSFAVVSLLWCSVDTTNPLYRICVGQGTEMIVPFFFIVLFFSPVPHTVLYFLRHPGTLTPCGCEHPDLGAEINT